MIDNHLLISHADWDADKLCLLSGNYKIIVFGPAVFWEGPGFTALIESTAIKSELRINLNMAYWQQSSVRHRA